MQKNLILISLLVVNLLASACTAILPDPHRIDIQQGNHVKPEDLEKIRIGMSRDQVRFVLGTPLLQDAFHRDRWDYVYYLKPGDGETRQSRVSLYFQGDELVRIDTSGYQPDMQDSPKKE